MTITLNTETAVEVDLDNLAAVALSDDMALTEATRVAKSSKDRLKKALEDQGLLNSDFKGTDLVHCTITEPMVFDPKKAMELLTPEEIAKYSALSGSLVKNNLAPAAYELLRSPGTKTLKLSVQS